MKRWACRGVLYATASYAAVYCALAGSPEAASAQDWLSPISRPIKATAPRPGSAGQPAAAATKKAVTPAAAPVAPPTAKKAEELVRWDVLGRSFENRVIEYAQFGSGQHRVLVVGALRGDEPEGVALAQFLGEHLTRFPQRLGDVTVTIVRDPNPDGRARRTSGNARGVELDRNFLSSGWRTATERLPAGQQPESEPETRVLADLMIDVKPERVIILGTSPQNAAVSYCGPAEYLAAQVAIEIGGQASRVEPNATAGSLMTMTGVDRGIPTLWIGLTPQASGDTIWSANKRGLLTAIGCGTPVEFVSVALPLGARPAVSQSPPNQPPSPAAPSSTRRSSIIPAAETRPANAPQGVPAAATAAPRVQRQTPAALPPEAPQPLYYNQLRFGRPAVTVVSPRAQRLQRGLPAIEQPTLAPNVAPQAPTSAGPTSSATAFEPPFDPRIQRLPPAQLFATPRRSGSVPAGMPQQPIPVYPHTGY